MLPHDPDYVSTMMDEDYDPHLATALASGFISEEDVVKYKTKSGTESDMKRIGNARASGKTLNYALVYGSGVETIVRSSSLTVEEATAGREGYWKLNWSVRAIAEEQVIIKDSKGFRWLINPINGFLYNIRSEKDIFSTLCQGSGSFMFDMWLDSILSKMEEKWGVKSLTAQFHDEWIVVCKNREKVIEAIRNIAEASIAEVSKKFKLRRELGCEIQVGYRYSEIH